jgi:Cytochrome C oxidase, cbb3-type, subunit III
MSLLLRGVWPVFAAALLAAGSPARADEPPPAAAPDQTAAKPEAPATAPDQPAEAAKPEPAAAAPAASPPTAGASDTPLYRVVDGNQVDHNTMQGWRTWRAMACERCHGANQEGLVGPSLVLDLKTQTKDDFKKCVLEGRIDKGMPNFGEVKTVVDNIDNLYSFLKGRSDGAIATGHLKEIE